MKTRWFLTVAAIVLGAANSQADSIRLDGTLHEGVHIKESTSVYYVRFPESGETTVVLKANIDPADLTIAGDAEVRENLMETWRAIAKPAEPEVDFAALHSKVLAAASEGEASFETPVLSATGDSGSSAAARSRANAALLQRNAAKAARGIPSGYVPYINLNNVPLKDAMRSVLRTQGLDYKVIGNMVWVSDPRTIRNEPFEPVVTRHYQLRNLGSETLPKIVVRNPFGVTGGGAGGGFGGGGLGGGGFGGGGNFGGGGFGGGGLGGGFGGGGLGGGLGGGGFGGGGLGGGGFGGGGAAVGQVSNISQLFGNIDDRLVGEIPAVIAPTGVISTFR